MYRSEISPKLWPRNLSDKMKRWIPFIFFICLALILASQLFFSGQSQYIPDNSDPGIIYKEACLECHGNGRQAANLWSPDLSDEILPESEIRQIVREGSWRMPAFPLIPDLLLDSLATYVAEKGFVEK